MMHPNTLITGGCRSGKSSYALKLGEAAGGQHNLFIATCVAHDDEMRARVVRHQQARGPRWQTLEVPLELTEIIARHQSKASVMVVDCLTLWLTNLMMAGSGDKTIIQKIESLSLAVNQSTSPIILVSNEVGAGIVPENSMARRFRDLAGWANQHLAAACPCVIWMVAGIPVTIKPQSDGTFLKGS